MRQTENKDIYVARGCSGSDVLLLLTDVHKMFEKRFITLGVERHGRITSCYNGVTYRMHGIRV